MIIELKNKNKNQMTKQQDAIADNLIKTLWAELSEKQQEKFLKIIDLINQK